VVKTKAAGETLRRVRQAVALNRSGAGKSRLGLWTRRVGVAAKGSLAGWRHWAASPWVPEADAEVRAPGAQLLVSGMVAAVVVGAWSRTWAPVALAAIWLGGYGLSALISFVGGELGGQATRARSVQVVAESSCPWVLAVAAARLEWWPVAAGLGVLSVQRTWVGWRDSQRFTAGRMLAVLVLAATLVLAAVIVMLALWWAWHRWRS